MEKRGRKKLDEKNKRRRYQVYIAPEVYEQFDLCCRLGDKSPSRVVEQFMVSYVADHSDPGSLGKFLDYLAGELRETLEYEGWLRDVRVNIKQRLGDTGEE